jgi:hypothetical protein
MRVVEVVALQTSVFLNVVFGSRLGIGPAGLLEVFEHPL